MVDGTTNFYFSDAAGVLLEAGASNPAPEPTPEASPAPTPVTTPELLTTPEPVAPVSSFTPQPAVPSSCGPTESFLITSAGLPAVEGCFQATEYLHSGGDRTEVWSVSGVLEYDQVVVSGNQNDGEDVSRNHHEVPIAALDARLFSP